MSAPRRPGDDRRAGRPGKATRDARPDPGKDKPEPVAKPARKARAEGWAKAKPPRDKPGRKSAARLSARKAADRATPMREDGPRRDDDGFAARREAAREGAPREAPARDRAGRSSAPRRGREGVRTPAAERPKRAFGDAARNRAAARAARDGDDDGGSRRIARTEGPRAPRTDAPRPERAPRGTATLRPAYGAPRPVRDEAARPGRKTRGAEQPTATPAAAKPAAKPVPRPSTPGKTPNRAARRAGLREAAVAQGSASAARSSTPDAPIPADTTRHAPQRIAKLLARAGIASRREIERMIEERRIAIDGVPLETPATILTSLHGVTVDGKPVAAPTAARLFLFHKPAGVLTAERDFSGRRTIYDLLPEELPRVVPVGRLDLNTEGLLLLTTDGELKRKLELPSTGLPRVYRARAYGDVTQAMLEALSDGVEIDGIRYGPIDANLERRTGANVWIEMRITEGKNREVRRVLDYLGLQVSRLIRLAYAEFVLADLAAGGIVEVRERDLVAFRQSLR